MPRTGGLLNAGLLSTAMPLAKGAQYCQAGVHMMSNNPAALCTHLTACARSILLGNMAADLKKLGQTVGYSAFTTPTIACASLLRRKCGSPFCYTVQSC